MDQPSSGCGCRKACGITFGHDTAVTDYDDGAHAGTGQGVVGEQSIECCGGRDGAAVRPVRAGGRVGASASVSAH